MMTGRAVTGDYQSGPSVQTWGGKTVLDLMMSNLRPRGCGRVSQGTGREFQMKGTT